MKLQLLFFFFFVVVVLFFDNNFFGHIFKNSFRAARGRLLSWQRLTDIFRPVGSAMIPIRHF